MKQMIGTLVCGVCLVTLSAAREIRTEGLSRTEWAPRLADGPVRAVFLANYGAHQDSFELLQRFDIEGQVVPVTGSSTGSPARELGIRGHYWPDLANRSGRRVANDIRKALASDWEVVVLSTTTPVWSAYPDDIRKAIVAGVAGGKALVCGLSDPVREDLAAAGLGLEKSEIGTTRFPAGNIAGAEVQVYRCGPGHVVHFDIPSDRRVGYLLENTELQADFERSAARAGWFLCRVARPAAGWCMDSTRYAEGKLQLKTVSPGTASDCQLRVTVRRRDNYTTVFKETTNCQPGGITDLALPYLPHGEYQAEVIAQTADGEVCDWDAIRFARDGRVKFEKVTVGPEVCQQGDTITCHLEVTGPAEGLQVHARWFDHWNRLLAETAKEPFSETLTMEVPQGSLSVLNHLELVLTSRRGTEAVWTSEILLAGRVRPADDFYVLHWNGGLGSSWRRQLYYDSLRRKGLADAFSNCMRNTVHARSAALAHMRTVPYTTAFHKVNLAEHLFDKTWMDDLEQRARDTARAHGPYNTLAYTLGDENYVNAFDEEGRFCNNRRVWGMFGDFLRQVYPDIESLNRQWETDFGDWGDVEFSGEQEMLENLDNPSPWVDYRMFISREFAAAHQRMRRAIQEEDPGATVGWDGAEQFSSYDGYDWWQMTRQMDLINVYHAYLNPGVLSNKIFNGRAIKSFRPDAALRGAWLNVSDRHYGGQYHTWYLLLNGWNSIWWWHASFLHPANGAMQWDLKSTPIMASAVDAAGEIKRGPATLLAHAQKVMDPVAVHYSENNFHASTIESGIGNHVNNLGLQKEFWMAPSVSGRMHRGDAEFQKMWSRVRPAGHYAVSSKNFYLLLNDLGLQPRTMARQEIEANCLERDGTEVLVLPFTVSLTEAEIDKIRRFVAEGGLLIADYRCGLRDLHCKLRPSGGLDDVFAIQRNRLDVNRGRTRVVAEALIYHGAEWEVNFYEPLTADGADVLGYHEDGTPAVLVNSYGEGTAIYLNCDIYEYDQLRRMGREGELRELVRALLVRYADLDPTFGPEHENGHAIGATEVTHFHAGDTHYYGVLPDYSVDDKSARPATLKLPAGSHFYDVRQHRYLGESRLIKTTLAAGQAKMIAGLPYQVLGVHVRAAAQARRGEPLEVALEVVGSGPNVGPHAARVEVIYPGGARPEYLARTLYLPGGKGQVRLVPALNTPRGEWEIRITECVSGAEGHVKVDIR
jgi:hypothetical protein